MQTSRPNAVSRRSQLPAGARSTSPLVGDAPRSPLTSTARLAGQLGAMSVNAASKSALSSSPPSKSRPTLSSAYSSHRKSKSVSGPSSSLPSRGGKSSETSSTRTSPVKLQNGRSSSSSSSTHTKTPSRTHAATLLSKSAGPSTSTITARDSLIAAGGLGRMDIVTKDWDGPASSSSAGSSPQKRRPSVTAKKYDRFIPSRENSATSTSSAVEENTTQNFTANGSKKLKPRTSDANDSFEAERSDVSEADAAANANPDGFDDSPPPSPRRQDSQQHTTDQAHTAELSSSLGIELGRRILSFSAEPPPASNEHSSLLAAYARGEGGRGPSSYHHQGSVAASQRRRIPSTPERVLDAPGLMDDYYLNLLDWSCTNLLAIALLEIVYIWNAESGEVGTLCSVAPSEDEETDVYVSSVRFSEDGSYLAVGTSSGLVQIYDLSTSTRIRTMAGHASRIPSLSWSGAILSSGSRDGSIWNSDVRIAQHKVAELNGHSAEVCGLEWRKDTGLSGTAAGGSAGGMGLLASGGNDNVVNVWDGRMLGAPKMMKTNHTAAVKALAWCPWQTSLLASGGGSSDRTIHFWNTTTSARLNSLVTPSQVTSLVFNPHSREILSSHGFPDHQLSIWTYPTLSKVIDITQAHETRVLHSCLNPDGTTLATASSDENLKFWKVFDLPKKGIHATSSRNDWIPGINGGKGVGGEMKNEHDVGRRGRTGLAIR